MANVDETDADSHREARADGPAGRHAEPGAASGDQRSKALSSSQFPDDHEVAAQLRAAGVELNQRGLVPLTETEGRVRRIGAAFTLALALVFVGVGVHSVWSYDRYLTEGTPVMGNVIESARDGSSVRVEFELPDGKTSSFLTAVPEQGTKLESGAPLAVRYFAEDGSDARLDDSRGYWAPMMLGAFLSLMLFGASFLFYWTLRGKDPELVLLTLAEDAARAKEDDL